MSEANEPRPQHRRFEPLPAAWTRIGGALGAIVSLVLLSLIHVAFAVSVILAALIGLAIGFVLRGLYKLSVHRDS